MTVCVPCVLLSVTKSWFSCSSLLYTPPSGIFIFIHSGRETARPVVRWWASHVCSRGLSLSNFFPSRNTSLYKHIPQNPNIPIDFLRFLFHLLRCLNALYKFTFMHAHEFFCFFICFYFISFVYYIENKQNKNVCFFFLLSREFKFAFPPHFTLFIIIFSFSCLLMLLLFYFTFFSFLFFLSFIH